MKRYILTCVWRYFSRIFCNLNVVDAKSNRHRRNWRRILKTRNTNTGMCLRRAAELCGILQGPGVTRLALLLKNGRVRLVNIPELGGGGGCLAAKSHESDLVML